MVQITKITSTFEFSGLPPDSARVAPPKSSKYTSFLAICANFVLLTCSFEGREFNPAVREELITTSDADYRGGD